MHITINIEMSTYNAAFVFDDQQRERGRVLELVDADVSPGQYRRSVDLQWQRQHRFRFDKRLQRLFAVISLVSLFEVVVGVVVVPWW